MAPSRGLIPIASLSKAPASKAEIAKMVKAGEATGLPGITEAAWYSFPALKVGGKGLVGAR